MLRIKSIGGQQIAKYGTSALFHNLNIGRCGNGRHHHMAINEVVKEMFAEERERRIGERGRRE